MCYGGDVRLVGGEHFAVGRLEVCNNNNTWGTVCDMGWDNVDADAACMSAGFYWGTYLYTKCIHTIHVHVHVPQCG